MWCAPSGHSLRGWGISLLLAQIAPERAAEIFKRGWDYSKTSQAVGVRTATIVEHPANHAYSLNGTAANGARRGIIIQNGQKIQVM